jgi:hypothetical protein
MCNYLNELITHDYSYKYFFVDKFVTFKVIFGSTLKDNSIIIEPEELMGSAK